MYLKKKHPLYQEDLKNILSINGIDTLKGKRILITGATGLIGLQMIDALMLLGEVTVYAVGRSREKAKSRLGEYYDNPNFVFIEQDILNPFPLNLFVDYIIPCASNTHPLAYSRYPIETILINVKSAEHALELASRCKAEVLYPSSVEVYGNARSEDILNENYTGNLNLTSHRSCYPESKRVSEALCQSYLEEKGVVVKIVRLSRIFGPTMIESDSKASSQFIKKALAGDDIVLKSKGDQFFSYTYVADAVAAMLYVMIHGDNGNAYNISNRACNVHLKEFAQICSEFNGKDVVYNLPSVTEQKGFSNATQSVLANDKLISIGFKPIYSLRDAIFRTCEILS